jgi:hypothetical protein
MLVTSKFEKVNVCWLLAEGRKAILLVLEMRFVHNTVPFFLLFTPSDFGFGSIRGEYHLSSVTTFHQNF